MTLGAPTLARAEQPDVALIPVTGRSQSSHALQRIEATIERALRAREIEAATSSDLRKRVEQLSSREPVEASEEELEEFVALGRDAPRAIAEGDWDRAWRELEPLTQRTSRALESFNRDPIAARHLFRACLLRTRVLYEAGNEEGAVDQAMECRAQSPGMELSTATTELPEYLLGLLQRAAATSAARASTLRIDTASGASCPVRVNGALVGSTPFELTRLPSMLTTVQVECDPTRIGRVHVLTAANLSAQDLVVDTAYEAALRTSPPGLRLSYDHPDPDLAKEHARTVLTLTKMRAALLIVPAAHGDWELRRVDANAAGAAVRVPADLRGLDLALERVLQLQPDPIGPRSGPVSRAAPTRRRISPLAIATLTLGVGLEAGAIWAVRRHASEGRAFRQTVSSDPAYLAQGQRWSRARAAPFWAQGASSAFAAVGAAALGVKGAREAWPSWWTFAGTSLGASLALWGSIELARGGACATGPTDLRQCVLAQQQLDRGALLLMGSLPFFTIPLANWLARGSRQDRMTVHSAVSPQSVSTTFTLRF
ncbi:MAG TPA: hypothetical protein VFX59_22040 [Polyangiales bacterium]|nr:hypothetical protein [Polyangiales bacterium]